MGDLVSARQNERARLHVWVPTNRRYRNGCPKAMDGLNEIIADNRAHRNKGARIERENVEWVSWYVLQAMKEQDFCSLAEPKDGT